MRQWSIYSSWYSEQPLAIAIVYIAGCGAINAVHYLCYLVLCIKGAGLLGAPTTAAAYLVAVGIMGGGMTTVTQIRIRETGYFSRCALVEVLGDQDSTHPLEPASA